MLKFSAYLIPLMFLSTRGNSMKQPPSDFEAGRQDVIFQFCEASSGCFLWKEANGGECPSLRENVPPLKENPHLNWKTKTKQIGTWIYYEKENFNVDSFTNKSIDSAGFKMCHSILESDCKLNAFQVNSFRHAALKNPSEDPVITIFYWPNFSGVKQVISPENTEKLKLPGSLILTGKSEWTIKIHGSDKITQDICIRSNVPHGPGLMTNLEAQLRKYKIHWSENISFTMGCTVSNDQLTLPSLILSQ